MTESPENGWDPELVREWDSRTLDLDDFIAWLAEAADLKSVPDPEANLCDDLGIDDFSYAICIVPSLDALVPGWAPVDNQIFQGIRTVRDLYLYYLTVC